MTDFNTLTPGGAWVSFAGPQPAAPAPQAGLGNDGPQDTDAPARPRRGDREVLPNGRSAYVGRSGTRWEALDRRVRPADTPVQVELVRNHGRALGALRGATAADQASLDAAVPLLLGTSRLVVPVLLDQIPPIAGHGTRYLTTWATSDSIRASASESQDDDSLAHSLRRGLRLSPTAALELLAPLGDLLDVCTRDGLYPVELSPDHLIVDHGSLRLVGFSRHGYLPAGKVRPDWEGASSWTRDLLGHQAPPTDEEELRQYQTRALWALAGWLGSGRRPAAWSAVATDRHLAGYLRDAGFAVDPFADRDLPLGQALIRAAERQRTESAVRELAHTAAVVVFDGRQALDPQRDETYQRSLVKGIFNARVQERSDDQGPVRVTLRGGLRVRLDRPDSSAVPQALRSGERVTVEITRYDTYVDKRGQRQGTLRGRQVWDRAAQELPARDEINPEAVRLAAVLERGRPVLGIARLTQRQMNSALAGLLGTSGWILTEDDPAPLLRRARKLCSAAGGQTKTPDLYLVGPADPALNGVAAEYAAVHRVVPGESTTFSLGTADDGTPVRTSWQDLPFVSDLTLDELRETVFPGADGRPSSAGKSLARQTFPVAFATLATDPKTKPSFVDNELKGLKEILSSQPDLLMLVASDLTARRRGLGPQRVKEQITKLDGMQHLLHALPVSRELVTDVVRIAGDRIAATAVPALLALSAWLDVLEPYWSTVRELLIADADDLRVALERMAALGEALTRAPDLNEPLLDLALRDAPPAALVALAEPQVSGRARAVLNEAGPALTRALTAVLARPLTAADASSTAVARVDALLDRLVFCSGLPHAEDVDMLTPDEAAMLLDTTRLPDDHLRVWGTALPGVVCRGRDTGYDINRLPELVAAVGATTSGAHKVARALLGVDQHAWAEAHELDPALLQRWWETHGDLRLLAPLAEKRWDADQLLWLWDLAEHDTTLLAEWLDSALDATAAEALARLGERARLDLTDLLHRFSTAPWPLPAPGSPDEQDLVTMATAAQESGLDLGLLLSEWQQRLPAYRQFGKDALQPDMIALEAVRLLGRPLQDSAALSGLSPEALHAAVAELQKRPMLAERLAPATAAQLRGLLAVAADLPDDLAPGDLPTLASHSEPGRLLTLMSAAGLTADEAATALRLHPRADAVQAQRLAWTGPLAGDLRPEDLAALIAVELERSAYRRVAEALLAGVDGTVLLASLAEHGALAVAALSDDVPEEHRRAVLIALYSTRGTQVAPLQLTPAHVPALATAEARASGTLAMLAHHGGGLYSLLCGAHGPQALALLQRHKEDRQLAACLAAGGEEALEPLERYGPDLCAVLAWSGAHPRRAGYAALALETVDMTLAGRRPLTRRAVGRLLAHTPLYEAAEHPRVRIPLAAEVLTKGLAADGAGFDRLWMWADDAVHGLGTR
ncbi:hypothetical protein [Streptomyces sp. NPDC002250]|uniref:hypothetical protein n=1 Tax=Streptomyces sp. NPDC002250 TaxID=3364641 RepID=UPI0036C6B0B5